MFECIIIVSLKITYIVSVFSKMVNEYLVKKGQKAKKQKSTFSTIFA